MEESGIRSLKKELRLKQFQFDSLYEFSSVIYSSFKTDSILRLFFSSLMGQLGISRVFFLDRRYNLLRKKGFSLTDTERKFLIDNLKIKKKNWFYLDIEKVKDDCPEIADILLEKRIYTLVNLDESGKQTTILGLGSRLQGAKLNAEFIEYTFFLGRFMLIALENSFMIEKMIQNEKLEREMEIAKEIQESLLPDKKIELKNFELAITYEPINAVGGDYYDILGEKRGNVPILIADVEGKGLPAALLAASSQAVLHSLHETFSGSPAKLMEKANALIYEFTKGKKFITIFFMHLNEKERMVSYVNAGHVEPLHISGNKVRHLNSGGVLTGFSPDSDYKHEDIKMKRGDLLAVFTDGVPEIADRSSREFGEERLIDFLKKNSTKSAEEINRKLFEKIKKFSGGRRATDDCTFLLLKSK